MALEDTDVRWWLCHMTKAAFLVANHDLTTPAVTPAVTPAGVVRLSISRNER